MTATARPSPSVEAVLPRLRADLGFELIPDRGGGYPSLIVSDPVRGTYYRLAWPESGILQLWREASKAEDLDRRLRNDFGIVLGDEQRAAVEDFLFANQLTVTDRSGTWHRYAAIRLAGRHGLWKTVMHGYLFFRMPLLHPEPVLRRMLPHISFVYARAFWTVLLGIALIAAYLATRQWTALEAAARDALQLEGMAVYGLAVLSLKAIHELGHALTTVRYGCRVPSMGIAVMLGAPVFYTDTSDSWRLSKRAERLAIVFAGVGAELIVATFAILMWCFLPDGLGRDISFAFATTSIALSLAINLNPFMRFDGYFALSDYLEVPNLQPRSFALAVWKLREVLFGLGHAAPEYLPPNLERRLIVYAVLTAIYRFFLFMGIAVLVYYMAGKAIGIILAVFELAVFIARPIVLELLEWWKLRGEIRRSRRSLSTMTLAAASAIVVFAPWVSSIQAPAVLVADQEQAIYLPFAARLTAIHVSNAQTVEAGNILFAAESKDLQRQYEKAILELQFLKFQSARVHASPEGSKDSVVVERERARAQEAVAALDRQRQQLVIRAPFSGMIVDLDPDIAEGLWLDSKRPLARVVSHRSARVRGLVPDTDVERVLPGARAVFIADDAASPQHPAVVESIARSADGRLAEPVLADIHGGGIAAIEQDGGVKTRSGWFEVSLSSQQPAPAQLTRGVVHIEAGAVSPFMLAWRQVARVLVREQGF